MSGYYQVPLEKSSKDIPSFKVPQGRFRFNVLPMGLKPLCNSFNPATKMIKKNEHKKNIKFMDHMAGGSKTAVGIRTKIKSLLDLCRINKIALNSDKFVISHKIEVGGFEISSDDSDTNPMIRPTKLAVNNV